MAEQKQGASGALPKNIRQIGTNIGNVRVYMEDYVYTYLHTQEKKESWLHRGFVLLGQIRREKEFIRYFVSGLISIKDEFFKDGILEFSDDTWAYIFQEMKKYYDNLEVIGWGQDVSGASASLTAELERNHKQNFNIQKNVLFLLDIVEGEEAFYIYEKNMLQRREGYYVYYEKNPQMQEYMVETQKSQALNIPREEIQEPVMQSYREVLLEKKAQMSARKWNGVLYTTSLLLVLSVFVLGVNTVNNVEKMQNLESTVNQISGKVEQADALSPDADAAPAMSKNTQQTNAEDISISDPDQSMDKDTSIDSEQNTDQDADQKDSDKETPESEKADNTNNADQEEDGETTQLPQTSVENTDADVLTEVQTYLLQGYYVVKKGDSLVGISKKIYGTPKKVKKICSLNGIEDQDKIYTGQRLELP